MHVLVITYTNMNENLKWFSYKVDHALAQTIQYTCSCSWTTHTKYSWHAMNKIFISTSYLT